MRYSVADISTATTNNLGVSFCKNKTINSGFKNIPVTPQIKEIKLLSLDSGWHTLEVNYKAEGNERYLLIGNFDTDINTKTKLKQSGFVPQCFLYIDNVSLTRACSTL